MASCVPVLHMIGRSEKAVESGETMRVRSLGSCGEGVDFCLEGTAGLLEAVEMEWRRVKGSPVMACWPARPLCIPDRDGGRGVRGLLGLESQQDFANRLDLR